MLLRVLFLLQLVSLRSATQAAFIASGDGAFVHKMQSISKCHTVSDGGAERTYRTQLRTLPVVSSVKESFQVRLNEFFKGPVPAPIRNAIALFSESGDNRLDDDAVSILTAAPGKPGVPRPLWLVMSASIPTGLLWYGYYKFAIEEELLQREIDAGIEPRGYGGYGTLGPSTYGMLMGPLAQLLNLPGGMNWSLLGICFIYYTQFLLYDRVNQAHREEGLAEPLQVWWCVPLFFPFNEIVALRQVHFLSQYFYRRRGMQAPIDPIAEFLPFIKAPPFTWQEFCLKPSLWCELLSEAKDIDKSTLPDAIRNLLDCGSNKNDVIQQKI